MYLDAENYSFRVFQPQIERTAIFNIHIHILNICIEM